MPAPLMSERVRTPLTAALSQRGLCLIKSDLSGFLGQVGILPKKAFPHGGMVKSLKSVMHPDGCIGKCVSMPYVPAILQSYLLSRLFFEGGNIYGKPNPHEKACKCL